MERFEYQITFLSFIIGLGVADLLSTMIRLLKEKSLVKWHLLTIIWVTIAFMGLLIAWGVYQYLLAPDILQIGPVFIFALTPAIFIFAFTVSILPHKIPERGINLKEYFFNNHKLIFSLFSLDLLSRLLTAIFIKEENTPEVPAIFWASLIVIQILVFGLIWTKNNKYHYFVAILVFLFYLLMLLGQQYK